MVRSNVSPGGSGAPPGSPRLRRAPEVSAQVDVEGAVAWARGAAAGELWAVRRRNRGIDVDEEQLRAVMLAVRQLRYELDPDDPDTPYPKKQKRHHKQGTRSSERIAGRVSRVSSFLESTSKHIGIDPDKCAAAVPEWINDPSEECKANYRSHNDTLQRMGTVVMLPPIVDPPKTRKSEDGKCKCSDPGSETCAKVHVKEAWKRVKYQLGEQAFRNCGFDAMGERVLKLWTAEDKKKLADIEKLIPQSKCSDKCFMKVALKQFSSERTTDLAKYYYNIFLPRRLASLSRAEATYSIDVSLEDEGKDQVHLSREKGKGSGSSSKR
ncbi:AT-rich interactive domain-containing protein 2 [Zea mays]|nr:AT-rich interactive domain-containing protein 2 [Zea mays]